MLYMKWSSCQCRSILVLRNEQEWRDSVIVPFGTTFFSGHIISKDYIKLLQFAKEYGQLLKINGVLPSLFARTAEGEKGTSQNRCYEQQNIYKLITRSSRS